MSYTCYHLLNNSNSSTFFVYLQSANFGKGFLGPDVPSEVVNEFVEMCHQLRVLNSVRDGRIGIPITFRQYPTQLCTFHCIIRLS